MALGHELRGALRGVSLKGASLALERGCRFAVVVASARALGDVAFGRFVFATTVTTILALGTDLGLGVWTTRALARDARDGPKIVHTGLALRSLASLPYAAAVAVLAAFSEGEARAAVVLLGLAALAGAFADHLCAVLRGYERFADEARVNASRALLVAAAGLGASAAGPSLPRLCAGLAAASFAAVLYAASVVVRVQGLWAWPSRANVVPSGGARSHVAATSGGARSHVAATSGGATSHVDGALAKLALRESLPIWFAGLVSIVYFKIDTVFVRAMAGEAELGAYGAAYKFFEGSMIVPAVLLTVAFPRLARAIDDPAQRRGIERALVALLVALGLLAGTACFFGRAMLVRVVFGPGYGRALDSLRVLALGLPLLYLNYGLTHFLVARDRGRVTLWLALMMLAVTIVLDIALVPRWLGPGAAWATVLAEVALTASCLGALRMGATPSRTLPRAPAAPRTGQRAA
jgi:O-antigen/teichoic acid export membrane protein